MGKKASPTLIGGFVVGALVLAIGALLLFGGGRFFSEKRRAVIYFQESVAGLSVGAQVNFNGVTVGAVETIELVYNVEDQSIAIPVFIQLFPDRLAFSGGDPEGISAKALIQRGLRAQLGLGSIITQQLVINLVVAPSSRIDLIEADEETFRTPRGIVEVPAIPSQMQELKTAIEMVVKNVAEMDVNQVLQQLQATIEGVKELVTEAGVQDFLLTTEQTLKDIRILVQKVDSNIAPLLTSTQEALKALEGAASAGEETLAEAQKVFAGVAPALASAQSALNELERTLASAGNVIEPGSPLYGQAMAALKEATSAARSLRALANQLERNPNSILFGRRR